MSGMKRSSYTGHYPRPMPEPKRRARQDAVLYVACVLALLVIVLTWSQS